MDETMIVNLTKRTLQDDEDLFNQLSESACNILHSFGRRANPSALAFSETNDMVTFGMLFEEGLNQFLARVNAWCEQNLPFSLFVMFYDSDCNSMVLFMCGMGHGKDTAIGVACKDDDAEPPDELVYKYFKSFLELCEFGEFKYQGEA